MSTTSVQLTTTPSSTRAVPSRRLLRAGMTAAVAGIATAEAYAAVIKAAGVPMQAGFLGASHASALNAGSFAMGVLVCTFWGTILAAIVSRVSARASRTFVVLGSGLTLLSLFVPLGAGATAASTKATLAVAHVLVASIVIPVLAYALRRGGDNRV
jgi:hypothetical protein